MNHIELEYVHEGGAGQGQTSLVILHSRYIKLGEIRKREKCL
jgi:hypothetical protein